jgi:hypothetical protein
MDAEMASELGEEVEMAMETLPPSFGGLIRNPHKKHHSQFKVYEWMALLHLYIIPIAWELGFNYDVLSNFALSVDIVEVAMSHTPKSDMDLAALYNLVRSFLGGFERLYVQNDPAKVSRCRLCIWQLIHVPIHRLCHTWLATSVNWDGRLNTSNDLLFLQMKASSETKTLTKIAIIWNLLKSSNTCHQHITKALLKHNKYICIL